MRRGRDARMTDGNGEVRADPIDVLRRRTSEKWALHGDDVLPMFVAETDFPLAPPIRRALERALADGDTGYVAVGDDRAASAISRFARDRWGWGPDPEHMLTTTDVGIVIVEALRALVEPGDGVIIMPPVYPPFPDFVREAGGVPVSVPLVDDGTAWSIDLDGVETALAAGARAVLLCSPHNPLGLVHPRGVLEALADLAERHGAFVVSDEIHAPLAHAGVGFTPFLSVSEAAREHGVAALSGSKAFNLAGLKCACITTASERTRALVARRPTEELVARAGLFGVIATQAGFDESRDWLDASLATVEANVALLERLLAERLPDVTMRRPHASYLAWLDFRRAGWGDDPADIALRQARVALANGPAFGAEGRGFARLNLACAPDVLAAAVDRLARVRPASPTR